MNVVLSTISKFHTLDLARQMERLGVLARLFTGRPRWKFRDEGLPAQKVTTFPYLQTVWEGLASVGLSSYPGKATLNWQCHQTLDWYVARHLPPCDVFHALVYCGLASGRLARSRAVTWVCDAPSPHVEFETSLLGEEFERADVHYGPPQQRFIDYALASYRDADAITVPSNFARGSFLDNGIAPEKIFVVPYGVSLDRFRPVNLARKPGFNVLFVGQVCVRKGIHDLIAGFQRAAVPGGTLTLVGPVLDEARPILARAGHLPIEIIGPVSAADLPRYYSEADVMALPSLSEGLALVLGQALACGCPVIATPNTGAGNLFTAGKEGLLVPARSPDAIASALTWMHEHPDERLAMGAAGLAHVQSLGGWDSYGDRMLGVFERLTGLPDVSDTSGDASRRARAAIRL